LPIHGALSDTPLTGTGCAFRDRCPHAFSRCEAETPLLRQVGATRSVACHLE
jgi:oligopeptide/dipeptide ABC transporter ATP-binding protein